jgi:hypothetical protein
MGSVIVISVKMDGHKQVQHKKHISSQVFSLPSSLNLFHMPLVFSQLLIINLIYIKW